MIYTSSFIRTAHYSKVRAARASSVVTKPSLQPKHRFEPLARRRTNYLNYSAPALQLQDPVTMIPITDCMPNPLQEAGQAHDLILLRRGDGRFECSRLMFRFSSWSPDSCDAVLRVGSRHYRIEDGWIGGLYDAPSSTTMTRPSNGHDEGHSLLGTSQHNEESLRMIGNAMTPGEATPAVIELLDGEERHARASFSIYCWSDKRPIAVCDIDGTITSSTFRGFIRSLVQTQTSCHDGVCNLLQLFGRKYSILYLTSRPLTLANETRRLLRELNQDDCRLPEGPVVGSPGTLFNVIRMELLERNVHQHKAQALLNLPTRNMYRVALGNTVSDMYAYDHAGVDRMYWVDSSSTVYALNGTPEKKAELDRKEYERRRLTRFDAGYKDTQLLDEVRGLATD